MKLSLQHIHIRSKDKLALADWYCKKLGFKIIEDLEIAGEPGGPILITSDDGITGLSIFKSQNPANNVFPAFGTDLETFFQIHRQSNQPQIYDHFHFFSFYLHDLDQNKIEICCIDYPTLKKHMTDQKIDFCLMTPETYVP